MWRQLLQRSSRLPSHLTVAASSSSPSLACVQRNTCLLRCAHQQKALTLLRRGFSTDSSSAAGDSSSSSATTAPTTRRMSRNVHEDADDADVSVATHESNESESDIRRRIAATEAAVAEAADDDANIDEDTPSRAIPEAEVEEDASYIADAVNHSRTSKKTNKVPRKSASSFAASVTPSFSSSSPSSNSYDRFNRQRMSDSSSYNSPPSQSPDPYNSSFNTFAPQSTFVSSHYRIDPASVLKYIGERKNLTFVRVGTDRINIKDCPFCRKPTHGKPDNQYKLTVWLDTGSHNCLRCGSKGSWFDFKRKLGDIPNITNVMGAKVDGNRQYAGSANERPNDSGSSSSSSSTLLPGEATSNSKSSSSSSSSNAGAKLAPPLPIQTIVHQYPSNLYNQSKYAPVLEYLLKTRGLTRKTLEFYQIGACSHKFPNHDKNGIFEEQICITMPWIKTRVQLEEMKHMAEGGSEKGKEKEKEKEKGGKKKKGAEIIPAETATPTSAVASSFSSVFRPPSAADQVTERIKLRSLTSKGNQRLLPSGGCWNFFGWHTVPTDAEELVITEGEFDAMAVYQGTKMPAVSLPNGARSLPVELLPLLERFKRIYLWLDDDTAGIEGAEKFARKLGVGRCLIVKSTLPKRNENGEVEEDDGESTQPTEKAPKDANDALRQGVNLRALIAAAQPLKHEQILQFSDLRSEVLREFTDPLARRGVQSRYLPGLNRILKGHRPGELTIVTGATGVGKTTVLSQISLDYCSQGVNTLWGSFEIRNTKLARTMISQYANMNFSTEIPPNTASVDADGSMAPEHGGMHVDPQQISEPVVPQPQTSPAPNPDMIRQFNLWADRFEQLPLYFMKFFGSNSVEMVLDAMEYAVYVYDVEHILLDNLQFMLSEQGKGGYDRFELQDRAIALFRQFASVKNVHITLVIHPRKEHDSHALGVASIFGGAKATQEADNILILQKPVSVDENMLGGGQAMSSELARLKAELDQARSSLAGGEDTSWLSQHRRIEIKKNRFDGELGAIPFKYDKRTCRIYEIQGGKKNQVNGGGGEGGNKSSAPPPAPRPPRPTRAVFFGGDQAKNDSAQATENANRAAAASMAPKAKTVKPKVEMIDVTPTSVELTSAETEPATPMKKKHASKKKTPNLSADTMNVNPDAIIATASDEPITPKKKRAPSKKKGAAPAPGSAARAQTLDSPPIEVVAD